MRIVQIAVASDPENGDILFGLDTYGTVHEYRHAKMPSRQRRFFTDRDGQSLSSAGIPREVLDNLRLPTLVIADLAAYWEHVPGWSAGWHELEGGRSGPKFHPEDPNH